MAKQKERELARFYFVEKLNTATQAAQMAGVSKQTLSTWVNKYGWWQQREACEQVSKLFLGNTLTSDAEGGQYNGDIHAQSEKTISL